MRALFAVVLVAPALLAGCAAPSFGAETAPVAAALDVVPYEVWKAGLSTEVFHDVVQEASVLRAEDGTSLGVTVWRPKDAGDAKLPTMLQITPYQSLDRAFMLTDGGPDFWPARGVVFVEADARGTHSSGGCLDFGGSRDRADAVAFAEWIRAQPWSDGRILTEGVSHPGMGVLVAQVAGVPGLVAGLAHAPVSSYYMDEWMNGAHFDAQLNGPAYQAIETLPTLDPSAETLLAQAGGTCQGETAVRFTAGDGTMTPWFADKDLNRLAGNVTAPVLLTIGFIDMNVFPQHVDDFWRALPPTVDKHLVLGYWTHGYPRFDLGYRIEDYGDHQHRWVDALLLDRESGLEREPRVVVQDSTGDWHELADWPPPGANVTTYWATPDGGLSTSPPTDGEASWVDDPQAKRDRWPDGARVLFEGEPLTTDLWVAGTPSVDLVAKSSADWTKYVVYLFDVAPDGSRTRVSHGFIDSRFPEGLEAANPPNPGEAATYGFDLFPTGHVVPAGHRLALLVASTDNAFSTSSDEAYTTCTRTPSGGCYDPSGIQPSPNPAAENTALLGVEGTRVTIPLSDPAEGRV